MPSVTALNCINILLFYHIIYQDGGKTVNNCYVLSLSIPVSHEIRNADTSVCIKQTNFVCRSWYLIKVFIPLAVPMLFDKTSCLKHVVLDSGRDQSL